MNDAIVVGGVLAVAMGLVEATKMLIRQRGSAPRNGAKDRTAQQIHDLWAWHNKEDDDGVKLWYVRPSLERSIERLADNLEVQTKILESIDRRVGAIER